ncbi:MAG: hypothetical protein IJ400_00130 [Clostridia bacterium]|nr:hypothetical protein [Clostridia bacterium]
MQIKTKGATPIAKNIIVVDEQGNKYEATYLKRAKGLVKNGRARFINENTICLACPPKEYLEDNKMENIENKLTEREIFEQIVALQKQLTDNNANSLHRLGDVIDSVYSTENDTGSEQVSEVCNVFAMREKNLRLMLEFYIKMYEDVRKTDEERKTDLIKSTISELSSKIKNLELPDDKLPTLCEITEATKELLTLLKTK